LALFGILAANAQNGPALFAAGYSGPPMAAISPGQIVTLWVAGLNQIPGSSEQSIVPLPFSVARISLEISQLTYGMGFPLPTLAVPILSITQNNLCSSPLTAAPTSTAAACLTSAITVQIPYELVAEPFTQPPYTTLTITQDGVPGPAIAMNTAPNNVHVLTCSGLPCITHADGSLVAPDSPASAGETLTAYLVGLGAPTPSPTTGQLTPAPAPNVGGISASLMFGANVRPIGGPVPGPLPGQAARISFAGMTPGQVGLYQINFQLPATFPAIPPCGANGNAPVYTNLTIDIGGYNSSDGAGICVQP
jgi:uncharacterized protein (TIGR03437 family)